MIESRSKKEKKKDWKSIKKEKKKIESNYQKTWLKTMTTTHIICILFTLFLVIRLISVGNILLTYNFASENVYLYKYTCPFFIKLLRANNIFIFQRHSYVKIIFLKSWINFLRFFLNFFTIFLQIYFTLLLIVAYKIIWIFENTPRAMAFNWRHTWPLATAFWLVLLLLPNPTRLWPVTTPIASSSSSWSPPSPPPTLPSSSSQTWLPPPLSPLIDLPSFLEDDGENEEEKANEEDEINIRTEQLRASVREKISTCVCTLSKYWKKL